MAGRAPRCPPRSKCCPQPGARTGHKVFRLLRLAGHVSVRGHGSWVKVLMRAPHGVALYCIAALAHHAVIVLWGRGTLASGSRRPAVLPLPPHPQSPHLHAVPPHRVAAVGHRAILLDRTHHHPVAHAADDGVGDGRGAPMARIVLESNWQEARGCTGRAESAQAGGVNLR